MANSNLVLFRLLLKSQEEKIGQVIVSTRIRDVRHVRGVLRDVVAPGTVVRDRVEPAENAKNVR